MVPAAVVPAAEDGTGMVGTLAGVFVFLAFLLVAVQVLVHLYATSMVTTAAFEAARLASGADAQAGAAEAHGLSLLGGFSGRVDSFDVQVGADRVVVSVRATSPALLPAAFGSLTGIGDIDREVVLRREQLVEAPAEL